MGKLGHGVAVLLALVVSYPPALRAAPWALAFDDEWLGDMAVLSDGGLVGSGSHGAGMSQMLVMRLAPNTAPLWLVSAVDEPPLPCSSGSQALGVRDDGVVVVAGSEYNHDSFGWVVAVDGAGSRLWQVQMLVGDCGFGNELHALEVEPAGDVVVAGSLCPRSASLDERPFLARLDRDGVVLWTVWFPDADGSFADIARLADGSLLAVGYVQLPGQSSNDPWLVKVTASGVVAWQAAHVGPGYTSAAAACVAKATGGAVVVGSILAASDDYDGWIADVDSDGNLGTDLRFQSPGWGWARDVEDLPWGGLALAGLAPTAGGTSYAGWLAELDPSFQVRRDWVLDGVADVYGLRATPDGGMVAVGGYADGVGPAGVAFRWEADAPPDVPCVSLADAGNVVEPGGRTKVVTTFAAEAPAALVVTRTDRAFVPESTAPVTCSASGCLPLTCGSIMVSPQPACAGQPLSLEVAPLGGNGMLTIEWDFDGNGLIDATGASVVAAAPAPPSEVVVMVSDECASGPQTCATLASLDVLPSDPPREVSDVLAGDPPLRVAKFGRLSFADVPEAAAYNVLVGTIGQWTSPSPGSTCAVGAVPLGAGVVGVVRDVSIGTWILVTASTPCAEGPAGRDSFGAERSLRPGWQGCGPTP